MAHKTNSKEQFLFKFYAFKFSFDLFIENDNLPKTLRQGAYALELTQRTFPSFETNLMSLKAFGITYPMKDNRFFQKLTHSS